MAKSITRILKSEISECVGSLQACAGQEARCEAAVHALHHIFDQKDTEGVLLIDTDNAFNCVNRNVFLHNIKILRSQRL